MKINRIAIVKKLLETGIIDRSTLSQVMLNCRDREAITFEVLANYTNMTTAEIRNFFEEHFGIPTLDLNDISLNPEIANLVPADLALNHLMIPAFRIIDKTHVAVSNPMDIQGLDEMSKYTGIPFSIFLSSEDQVIKAIRKSIKSEEVGEKEKYRQRIAFR